MNPSRFSVQIYILVGYVLFIGIFPRFSACFLTSSPTFETLDLTKDGMSQLRNSVGTLIIDIGKLIVPISPSGPVLTRLSQFAYMLYFLKYKDPVFQLPAEAEFYAISVVGKPLQTFVVNGVNRWLGSLTLDETSLERVPTTIANLPSLEMIYLNKNNIKVLRMDVFANNRQLMEVMLEECNVTQLVVSTRKDLELSITYLSLEDNRLRHLDMAAFEPLRNLTFLLLAGNPLVRVDSSSFVTLPVLETLYLQYGNLTSINLGRVATPNLRRLGLHNNNLQAVPTQLGVQKSLRFLTMTNNFIKEVDLAPLRLLPVLQTIDLDLCGVERVFSSITPLVLPNLQAIRLYRNNLSRLNLSGILLPKLTDISLAFNQFRTVPNLHARYPKVEISMSYNPISCNSLGPYKEALASRILSVEGPQTAECTRGSFVYDSAGSSVCCVA